MYAVVPSVGGEVPPLPAFVPPGASSARKLLSDLVKVSGPKFHRCSQVMIRVFSRVSQRCSGTFHRVGFLCQL